MKEARMNTPVKRDKFARAKLAVAKPKGRMLDPEALREVETLLGDLQRRRDLLIEALHRLQDGIGCLHAHHLKALATTFRISEAEVFEVASFYHHFDIVKEGDNAPPAVTIRVCDSLSCMMAGAEDLIARLSAFIDPAQVRVLRAPCIGRCAEAPAALVGRNAVDHATAETLAAMAMGREVATAIPAYDDLEAYRAKGGYQLFADCLAGKRTPEDVIAIMSNSGLRGLGGAGFPSGRKWSIVRNYPGPRLMTINGDEGEPGTFKDRSYLERDPHRMLEGALIAAWAVGCDRIYIYMRDEYPSVLAILKAEIAKLDRAGFTSRTGIELRRGAGAYICGEESAMIESIEGKKGLPRHRPPYIAEVGLFGRPTLNHNIETLYWVRDIVEKGADWFASQGRRGSKGLRSFSVSGRVRDPGVKLAPAGITVRELIDDYCGGIREGETFIGYLPGGASGGILPASLADEPLDFGTLDKHGCFIGSHAVVILSDRDDPKAVALNLMRFFKHESCGQCTPCRSGTDLFVRMMESGHWDPVLMADLDSVMRDASICGLGQAAANPVRSVLRFFKDSLPSGGLA
jgi:NADH:ubiquinone oxidoreductase subunit F (NADH-binding)/NADH:ubiquinone oxidoreductase subunit E